MILSPNNKTISRLKKICIFYIWETKRARKRNLLYKRKEQVGVNPIELENKLKIAFCKKVLRAMNINADWIGDIDIWTKKRGLRDSKLHFINSSTTTLLSNTKHTNKAIHKKINKKDYCQAFVQATPWSSMPFQEVKAMRRTPVTQLKRVHANDARL